MRNYITCFKKNIAQYLLSVILVFFLPGSCLVLFLIFVFNPVGLREVKKLSLVYVNEIPVGSLG